MRIIDVHCYPNTREWVACQQPYVDALAKYWNRPWVPKREEEVVQEFADAGIEAIEPGSVAIAVDRTLWCDRIRQKTPQGGKHRSGDRPLTRYTQFCNLPGEFPAAVEPQSRFPQQVAGQFGIVGTLDAPKPEALLIPLKELKRLLQLLHGTIKRGGKEVNG
jgi:hypothetical protein